MFNYIAIIFIASVRHLETVLPHLKSATERRSIQQISACLL